jgi:hypothetical protein
VCLPGHNISKSLSSFDIDDLSSNSKDLQSLELGSDIQDDVRLVHRSKPDVDKILNGNNPVEDEEDSSTCTVGC